MTTAELRERYRDYPVKLAEGEGKLPCLDIKTDLAEARIYLHGAHVAHFQPAGEKAVLFLSSKSWFQSGKPIRGGVPICYPWFGAKPDDPTAPAHGFARLQEWTVSAISELPRGEIGVILELYESEDSLRWWPHPFQVEHRIRVGRELSMSLVTRNTGKSPFTIHEALHSYFSVGDARQVSVTGLEGATYIDKMRGMNRFAEGNGAIRITAETDRHYVGTHSAVTIHDPLLSRRITVSKSESASTVVWNPWIAKAAAMPDFGDDEWPAMLCVETANAADDAVAVAPGQNHEMQAIISVERM